MCKFGYLRFLHTFPDNMLKNCGLTNINALLGQKGKNVTGKWDRAFFQTSNYIRAIFWKSKEHICIFVIFLISCAIQYHRSVFIFTVRRILSIQLWLNVLGHSLPTKLFIDPYKVCVVQQIFNQSPLQPIFNSLLAPATACESQATACDIEIFLGMLWIGVNCIFK